MWEIEPAELHRVYSAIAAGVTRTVTPDAEVTVELLLLRQERAAQAERLIAMLEERKRERRHLTALLTDQNAKQTHETPPRPAVMSRFLGFLPLVWKRQP